MASVTSVSVTPSALTLTVGSWYYYAKATVYPTSECCNCVTWHSDNECVATVNALTGYIYAKNAGTAKIYATATDGSGKSAYITAKSFDWFQGTGCDGSSKSTAGVRISGL